MYDLKQGFIFHVNSAEYIAYWKDICYLYEIDSNFSKAHLRMTKLTHTAIFPKILQRQSVPLVRKVFYDKTRFEAVKDKLDFQVGTVKFFTLITNWFQLTSVKDRYSAMKCTDDRHAHAQ